MSFGMNAQHAQQHSRTTAALLFGAAALGVIAVHLSLV